MPEDPSPCRSRRWARFEPARCSSRRPAAGSCACRWARTGSERAVVPEDVPVQALPVPVGILRQGVRHAHGIEKAVLGQKVTRVGHGAEPCHRCHCRNRRRSIAPSLDPASGGKLRAVHMAARYRGSSMSSCPRAANRGASLAHLRRRHCGGADHADSMSGYRGSSYDAAHKERARPRRAGGWYILCVAARCRCEATGAKGWRCGYFWSMTTWTSWTRWCGSWGARATRVASLPQPRGDPGGGRRVSGSGRDRSTYARKGRNGGRPARPAASPTDSGDPDDRLRHLRDPPGGRPDGRHDLHHEAIREC